MKSTAAALDRPFGAAIEIQGCRFGPRRWPSCSQISFERFDLQLDSNLRYINADRLVHCHNKMVIVDGADSTTPTTICDRRSQSPPGRDDNEVPLDAAPQVPP